MGLVCACIRHKAELKICVYISKCRSSIRIFRFGLMFLRFPSFSQLALSHSQATNGMCFYFPSYLLHVSFLSFFPSISSPISFLPLYSLSLSLFLSHNTLHESRRAARIHVQWHMINACGSMKLIGRSLKWLICPKSR